MTKILVLSTGGTIASRAQADGGARAVDTSEQLIARAEVGADVEVVTRDIFLANSFTVGPAQMLGLATEVRDLLRGPELDGVVITHGTDTLEESAFLLDLVHTDDRPVVFTGAQRPADASDSDGPRNLADAITVATDPAARGLGVLIVIDGAVYPAFGTRKVNTLNPAAFASLDNGRLGGVVAGAVSLRHRPIRSKPLSLEAMDIEGVRVDIAPYYPGSDTAVLDAFRAAGARGIVLQGTGAGNASSLVAEKVSEFTAAGIVVGLTTRVDAGPVAALYGNGGGVDLVRAGAIPMGILRAPQGRILLMAALATESDPARARDVLKSFL